MKLIKRAIFLVLLLAICTAAGVHKFYVGIYQIHYAPEKKMLQITTRIFIDDLNDVLQKKYNRKFHLGEAAETPDDVAMLHKYLIANFSVAVNKKPVTLNFLSKETENNVLICYFSVRDVAKPVTMQVANKILFDLVTEQQNIIQTTVNGKKNSLLLTTDNPEGTLTF